MPTINNEEATNRNNNNGNNNNNNRHQTENIKQQTTNKQHQTANSKLRTANNNHWMEDFAFITGWQKEVVLDGIPSANSGHGGPSACWDVEEEWLLHHQSGQRTTEKNTWPYYSFCNSPFITNCRRLYGRPCMVWYTRPCPSWMWVRFK